MALHRYGDFRVEVFYFDSPCIINSITVIQQIQSHTVSKKLLLLYTEAVYTAYIGLAYS